MSECKYCKSKERPSYDSDTKYECGSFFYFKSNFNQSNACKTISQLQSRIASLEESLEISRNERSGLSDRVISLSIDNGKLRQKLKVFKRNKTLASG